MTRAPGLYDNISDVDYHNDPDSLSSSGARTLIASTPAQFIYEQTHRVDKREFDIGRVAHGVVLGVGGPVAVLDPAVHGLKTDGTVAEKPSATTAWKRADAEARQRGETPVHIDDWNVIQTMAAKVREHPIAGPLLSNGLAEYSLYAIDPDTGVTLRARPDYMKQISGRLVITDYKSSKSAGPQAFAGSAGAFGYYMQHPFYTRVARLLGLDPDPAFLFVTQCKEPPYFVDVCELRPDDVELGDELNRRAIDIYAKCRATEEWPDYSDQIHQVSVPRWVRYQAEEKLS